MPTIMKPKETLDPEWQHRVCLFQSLFSGLHHVYGTYDPGSGRAWQVKAPVTDQVVLAHLNGARPYGVYLLAGDTVRAAAADFDDESLVEPLDFCAAARRYGMQAYIERSKSKGYHAWVFFPEDGVPARKARLVFRHILGEIGAPDTEIFPKQDCLSPGASSYGNFVNTPLFGGLVSKGRTAFLDLAKGCSPYPDQWGLLRSVKRVREGTLDEVIEVNELEVTNGWGVAPCAILGTFSAPHVLPPCARRMLESGVTAYQRVSCFRLAVHLRRVGLPFDLVVAALAEWSKKNRPLEGRRIITFWEVKAQAAAAFLKEYRGCGCEDQAVAPFCDTSCPLNEKRQ